MAKKSKPIQDLASENCKCHLSLKNVLKVSSSNELNLSFDLCCHMKVTLPMNDDK